MSRRRVRRGLTISLRPSRQTAPGRPITSRNMAHPRKFRFGVQAAGAPDGEAWRRIAQQAEEQCYSTLFIPDHFGDQLAPIPALMAAADATTTLRVGGL